MQWTRQRISPGKTTKLSLGRLLKVIVTVSILNTGPVFCAPCEKAGFFGDDCKFQCHCLNDENCQSDGSCPQGCDSRWFGPNCQYKSSMLLVVANGRPIEVLNDNDITTCMPATVANDTVEEVEVFLVNPHPVTWLSGTTNLRDAGNIELRIKVISETETVLCESKHPLVRGPQAIFACLTKRTATSIVLTGTHITTLCSVDVSIGRNLGLHQTTSQSSTFKVWESKHAVDGFVGPIDDQDGQSKTCTHTDYEDTIHTWNLRLDSLVDLLRIDIFNRVNRRSLCCEDRLRGFMLRALKDEDIVFTYEDKHSQPREVYTVTPERKLPVPVNRIHIYSRKNSEALNLCEVQVLGESICPVGRFGALCDRDCFCSRAEERCHILTGICTSGCRPGKTGDTCSLDCPQGTWGRNCDYRCSQNCKNEPYRCDPETGACYGGCSGDYIEPLCVAADCHSTSYFGTGCRWRCLCTRSNCDSQSGECKDGSICIKGHFGPGCQYKFDEEIKKMNEPPPEYLLRNVTCDKECTFVKLDKMVITWIRIVARDNSLKDVEMFLWAASSPKVHSCGTIAAALSTLDLLCKTGQSWDFLILKGVHRNAIFNLYISQGRNLALKSNKTKLHTNQFVPGSGPELALDGSTSIDGCFEIEPRSDHVNTTWFSVAIEGFSEIVGLILYSPKELFMMRGFILEVWRGEEKLIDRHLEKDPNFNKSKRKIMFNSSINGNDLEVTLGTSSTSSFVICEIEVLGETPCSPGMHGLDCKQHCNCLHQHESCLVTGSCISGCAKGFTGIGCNTECQPGTFGSFCKDRCSVKCFNGPMACSVVGGECEDGCVVGYQPPLCKNQCDKGLYGRNCEQVCGQFCAGGVANCHFATGECLLGCETGSAPPYCTALCGHPQYGENCTQTCSANCVLQDCDPRFGICDDCSAGYMGIFCEEKCPPHLYGPRCTGECSKFCLDDHCDSESGNCSGCVAGRKGTMCTELCDLGFYGKGCTGVCSRYCLGGPDNCNLVNGSCNKGCEPDYKPPFCSGILKERAHLRSEGVWGNTIFIAFGIFSISMLIYGFIEGMRLRVSHRRNRIVKAPESREELVTWYDQKHEERSSKSQYESTTGKDSLASLPKSGDQSSRSSEDSEGSEDSEWSDTDSFDESEGQSPMKTDSVTSTTV